MNKLRDREKNYNYRENICVYVVCMWVLIKYT